VAVALAEHLRLHGTTDGDPTTADLLFTSSSGIARRAAGNDDIRETAATR
jgi:hypothetical protein